MSNEEQEGKVVIGKLKIPTLNKWRFEEYVLPKKMLTEFAQIEFKPIKIDFSMQLFSSHYSKEYGNPSDKNESLPNDLWLVIFDLLDIHSVLALLVTCKKFRNLVSNSGDKITQRILDSAKRCSEMCSKINSENRKILQEFHNQLGNSPLRQEVDRRLLDAKINVTNEEPVVVDEEPNLYNDKPEGKGFVMLR